MRSHHLPLRIITGAFLLNSGLSKRNADADTASYLHGEAARAYPIVRDMDAMLFAKTLSRTEIGVGTALLLPIVPSALAGTALAGFSSGLLGLYFTAPDARLEDGIRPSPQGIALAKDSWLFGIGLSLIIDGLRPCRRHRSEKAHPGKKSRKGRT
ncbi:hypothetical protein [Salinactinospora qingdaonensis]|uniref:Uncharacterized protein n=1 Tax=Salinactinospora qingdaonensis TaxID=702744 RepID=A0ABP7G0A8_9ACTN